MLGKFFAFAMLVLIILAIIQFSTLSDEDVAKIKTRIEEQQKNKVQPKDIDSPSARVKEGDSETK